MADNPRWLISLRLRLILSTTSLIKSLWSVVTILLFTFLKAVDQNYLMWFSQKLLIIAVICYNRSIHCVISFKEMYTFIYGLVFRTLRDMNKNNIKITASRIANGVYQLLLMHLLLPVVNIILIKVIFLIFWVVILHVYLGVMNGVIWEEVVFNFLINSPES